MAMLPNPRYQPTDTDPQWLRFAAQFHGHLGPWAAAGLRAGAAARRAVRAKGYFDVDVVVEGSLGQTPNSCFLDGVQVSTGATWGKHNIAWTAGEKLVLRMKNLRSGATVEVHPSPALLEILVSLKTTPKVGAEEKSDDLGDAHDGSPGDSHDHHHSDNPAEALARKVAGMSDETLFEIVVGN